MDKSRNDVENLLPRIAQLEQAVADLSGRIEAIPLDAILKMLKRIETKVGHHSEHISVLLDTAVAGRTEHDERMNNAFERIKCLEVAVFPNLLRDIDTVYRIIGGDGSDMAPSPLDRRSDTPPKSL